MLRTVVLGFFLFLAACENNTSFDSAGNTAGFEDVIELCTTLDVQSFKGSLEFPAHQDCNWGTKVDGKDVLSSNGNFSRINGSMRAREQFTKSIDLPEGSVLCGVSIEAENENIEFDDAFGVHLNGLMIASAPPSLVQRLAQDEDGNYLWDWTRVRDDGTLPELASWQGPSQDYYCAVNSCTLPTTESLGGFALKMNVDFSSAFETNESSIQQAKLFSKLSTRDKLSMTLIATGDNDDGDCMHSGGTFAYDIKVVLRR